MGVGTMVEGRKGGRAEGRKGRFVYRDFFLPKEAKAARRITGCLDSRTTGKRVHGKVADFQYCALSPLSRALYTHAGVAFEAGLLGHRASMHTHTRARVLLSGPPARG
jgi:hypothetical protein